MTKYKYTWYNLDKIQKQKIQRDKIHKEKIQIWQNTKRHIENMTNYKNINVTVYKKTK